MGHADGVAFCDRCGVALPSVRASGMRVVCPACERPRAARSPYRGMRAVIGLLIFLCVAGLVFGPWLFRHHRLNSPPVSLLHGKAAGVAKAEAAVGWGEMFTLTVVSEMHPDEICELLRLVQASYPDLPEEETTRRRAVYVYGGFEVWLARHGSTGCFEQDLSRFISWLPDGGGRY